MERAYLAGTGADGPRHELGERVELFVQRSEVVEQDELVQHQRSVGGTSAVEKVARTPVRVDMYPRLECALRRLYP